MKKPKCPYCKVQVSYQEAKLAKDGYQHCPHCKKAIVWACWLATNKKETFTWDKPTGKQHII